jgi:branched-chain amino acid transport system permease protein
VSERGVTVSKHGESPQVRRWTPLSVGFGGGLAALLVLLAFVPAVFGAYTVRLGASLRAIRDGEDAGASLGVRVLRGKGILWLLAGLGCGAAGALILAHEFLVQPSTIFSVDYSAWVPFPVLVGGTGTFEGPIIGALVLFLIQNEVSNGLWYDVILGGAAIVFALFLPRGIWRTVAGRFGVRLLPAGYRLRGADATAARPSTQPEGAA